MVEKGITDGMYHAIHQYEKTNNKYTKVNYVKTNKSLYLKHWDVNDLYE